MKNILNIEVSAFENATSVVPKNVDLFQWLTTENNKSLVEKIRNAVDSNLRSQLKKQLPCITPSGIFKKRAKNELKKHSGFICIDIDIKDNKELENFHDLKDLIKDLDCVAYCSLSVSGEGNFALIPLSNTEKHKEHFESLKVDFKTCGIEIDSSCSDVSRLRFASYDEKPYINLNAKPYNKIIPVKSSKSFVVKKINATMNPTGISGDVEKLINEIESKEVDITENYKTWFAIGCSIAKKFGENGREYFHRISRYHQSYSIENTNTQYSACLNNKDKNEYNIETLFWYAKKAGLLSCTSEDDFSETSELRTPLIEKND